MTINRRHSAALHLNRTERSSPEGYIGGKPLFSCAHTRLRVGKSLVEYIRGKLAGHLCEGAQAWHSH